MHDTLAEILSELRARMEEDYFIESEGERILSDETLHRLDLVKQAQAILEDS